MTTPAPQTHAANSLIHPAAHRPQRIHVKPAALPADAHIRTMNVLGFEFDQKLARLDEHAFFHGERVWFDIARGGDERIRPTCFHVIALDAAQCEMQRSLEIHRLDVRK